MTYPLTAGHLWWLCVIRTGKSNNFHGVINFSGTWHIRRQHDACSDFVNLETYSLVYIEGGPTGKVTCVYWWRWVYVRICEHLYLSCVSQKKICNTFKFFNGKQISWGYVWGLTKPPLGHMPPEKWEAKFEDDSFYPKCTPKFIQSHQTILNLIKFI